MNERLDLREYESYRLPAAALPTILGRRLWAEYGEVVDVAFPSPKTADCWQLTPQGYAGYIPLSPTLHMQLLPKVSLDNLIYLLAYVYDLDEWRLLDGLQPAASLPGFYEQLADLLARRVRRRVRLGLHRDYLLVERPLPYLRGQLRPKPGRQSPTTTALTCRYQEQTAVISDNQLLAYTLGHLARGSLLTQAAIQQRVVRAYRLLRSLVGEGERPFTSDDCLHINYTRLNQDYRPLHALCRFFLSHTMPVLPRSGLAQTIPFLVDMARLYEQFVAAWLQANLPDGWQLQVQEQVIVGPDEALRFNIDLVLYDAQGQPQLVLDSKYKTPGTPSNPDFNQVLVYAQAKGCRQAVLVYPQPLPRPLDVTLAGVRVRSLTFALDGDVGENGRNFLNKLDLTGF
ncbi:MAG: restriction endonuclease [Chloroflexota bacterium]|jgi:5-methylcytosine-specific restriction enzyme subunit McrC